MSYIVKPNITKNLETNTESFHVTQWKPLDERLLETLTWKDDGKLGLIPQPWSKIVRSYTEPGIPRNELAN